MLCKENSQGVTMEHDRAKEILRTLADGRDPATGEQFPPNSPYQRADTVRALCMAVDALDNNGDEAGHVYGSEADLPRYSLPPVPTSVASQCRSAPPPSAQSAQATRAGLASHPAATRSNRARTSSVPSSLMGANVPFPHTSYKHRSSRYTFLPNVGFRAIIRTS